MKIKAVSMAVFALGMLGVAQADQDMDWRQSPAGNCQRVNGDWEVGSDGSLRAQSSNATVLCPIISAKPTTVGGNEWMMRDVEIRLSRPSGNPVSSCRIYMLTVDAFISLSPVVSSPTGSGGQSIRFRQDMGQIPIDTSQQNWTHAFYALQCSLAANDRMLYYRTRVDDDVIND